MRKQLSEFSPEEIQAAIDKEKAALDAQGVFRPEESTSDGEILEVKIILEVKRDNTLKAEGVDVGEPTRMAPRAPIHVASTALPFAHILLPVQ